MSKESEKYLQAILEKFCDHLNPIYYQEFSSMIFKYGEKCIEEAIKEKLKLTPGQLQEFDPIPKERKIIDYNIMTNECPFELGLLISGGIINGWQPYGGISISWINSDKKYYAQAMVKYE